MANWDVRHAMDLTGTVLGVLEVGEDDIVKSYTPAEGEDNAMPGAAGMPFGQVQALWSLRTFAPQGAEMRVGGEPFEEVSASSGDIVKVDPDKRLVFGWAYVTHDPAGRLNIDKSGDFADDIEEIEKSAYDFVLRSRAGDAEHTNVKGSDMVESIVFTPEKIEKMGLPQDAVPLGWWVGFKVHDEHTWERVKKGELKSFSIHGKGVRSKVE